MIENLFKDKKAREQLNNKTMLGLSNSNKATQVDKGSYDNKKSRAPMIN